MAHALSRTIARNFDAAASDYSGAADVQEHVAVKLVVWASKNTKTPTSILDIGSGTGFAAAEAARQWPAAPITALDAAPAMLREAQQRIPQLKIIVGDAAHEQPGRFDLIFSSMMLHWLPEPLKALRRWQGWLRPGGTLYVALLGMDSFEEWRALCHSMNGDDGSWPMPPDHFAASLATRCEIEKLHIDYPTAEAFLKRLKTTGAATPRPGYRPLNPGLLRRILRESPQPFRATYHVIYLEIPAL